jgi:hypothetical protein
LKDRYSHLRAVDDVATKTDKPAQYTVETLTGKHAWLTEEGSVVIEVNADMVLVTESLDQDTTAKMEQELFGTTANKGN